MRRNIGTMDKFLRVMISLPFLVYGFMHMSWIAGIVGVVLIGTAFVGFCGLYKLFGIDTCKKVSSGSCQI